MHPKGLKYLVMAEFWERFSFYSIAGLATLFLVKNYGLTDTQAGLIFGTLSASAYISTLLAGKVADKLTGYFYSATTGALMMCAGQIIMASFSTLRCLYLGISLIVIGTGFFKSCVSIMVGQLYEHDNPRRDSGFNYFYMGINVGALLAGIFASYVGEKIGWGVVFFITALGMIQAVALLAIGKKHFPEKSVKNNLKILKAPKHLLTASASIILVIAAVFFLLDNTDIAKKAIMATVLAFIVMTGILASCRKDVTERKRIFGLLGFMCCTTVFWSVFFMIFSAILLFIDRDVNRTIFGAEIPSGLFGLVPESIIVIALSPVFAWLWLHMAKHKIQASSITKSFYGLVFLLAMTLFSWGAASSGCSGIKINMLWLLPIFLALGIGELLISPVSLSMTSRLAPADWAAFCMGLQFLPLTIGSFIAGYITSFTDMSSSVAADIAQSSAIYARLFGWVSVVVAISAVIYLFFVPALKRLMNE